MTTTRIRRCNHCGVVYPYHPSTYGSMPEYNDSDHCENCAKVVAEALKAVPVKVSKRWVNTTDYTREEIIWAQDIRMEADTSEAREGTGNQIVCERMTDPVSKEPVYYQASW